MISGGDGNWFHRPLVRDPLFRCSVMAGVVVALVVAMTTTHHRMSYDVYGGFCGAAIVAVLLVSARALMRGFREPLGPPGGRDEAALEPVSRDLR